MIPISASAEGMEEDIYEYSETIDVMVPAETEDTSADSSVLEEEAPVDAEGTEDNVLHESVSCGDDLTWVLEDGILRITGTGDMFDFESETVVPWYDDRMIISEIELASDVTGIGSYAFYACERVSCYAVPDGIVRIGDSAFRSNVRILGKAGSEAERYAGINGNPFSALVSEPVLTSVSTSNGGVTVQWNAVDHAQLYRVYRKTGSSYWNVLGDTAATMFYDETVESGKTYSYTVQCFSIDGSIETSSYDMLGMSVTYISAPVIDSISASDGGVHITWQKVTGASQYRIFRRTLGKDWTMLGDTAETSYTDLTAEMGISYFYTIRCMDAFDNYIGSYDMDGIRFSLAGTPKIVSVKNVTGGIEITWGQMPGAAAYCIYRKSDGGSWIRIGQTSSLYYVDTDVIDDTRYSYTIQSLGTDGAPASEYDPVGRSIIYVSVLKIENICAFNGGVHIIWRKVTGASKYRIFRRTDNGDWLAVGDSPGSAFTDLTAEKGVSYWYMIRCIDSFGNYIGSYDPDGMKIIMYDTPMISSVSNDIGGVRISWEPVNGAESYCLFRKTGNGNWKRIGQTSSASYVDTDVSSGGRYRYSVRCLGADGTLTSDYDKTGRSILFIDAPALITGKNTVNGVVISWKKVPGASMYRVLRKTANGNWTEVGDTSATSFTDRSGVSDTTYAYTVCCIDSAGNIISAYDPTGITIIYVIYVAVPSISSINASNGGVTITWGQISGAARYRVFRKTATGDWSSIGDTTSASFTDKTAATGTVYNYSIRSFDSAGYFNCEFDSIGRSFTYAAIPVVSNVTNAYGGVSITWGKVFGADSYRVFRKTGNGSWSAVGETVMESFTDKSTVHGTAYCYTVRCVNKAGEYNSDYDTVGRSITYFAAPTVTCAFNVFNGVRITWGKIAGASMYRVFRRTAGTAWKSIGDIAVTHFLDTDATASTEYFYSVCCLDSAGNCISGYDPVGRSNKLVMNTKKIYLSPSNQEDNTFITGNANEGEVWNDIASRLVTLLAAYDCEVVIADYDMRLENRAEEANQWGADVYIAMHSNAYVTPNTCWGVEVYYDASKSNSAERKALATAFLNELTTLFTNRGLRTSSTLKDCRLPVMPSVIVECGFHDSTSDANRILNNKDLIAQLYCNALVSYLGLVRKS